MTAHIGCPPPRLTLAGRKARHAGRLPTHPEPGPLCGAQPGPTDVPWTVAVYWAQRPALLYRELRVTARVRDGVDLCEDCTRLATELAAPVAEETR